jgi:hypothetical protein
MVTASTLPPLLGVRPGVAQYVTRSAGMAVGLRIRVDLSYTERRGGRINHKCPEIRHELTARMKFAYQTAGARLVERADRNVQKPSLDEP